MARLAGSSGVTVFLPDCDETKQRLTSQMAELTLQQGRDVSRDHEVR